MLDIVIWLRNMLHRIPHLDFSFRPVDNVFVIDINDVYSTSLVLLAIFALAVGALFLLCLIIVWISSCCMSKSATGYSRRSVRRLTITLFLLNVICFLLLAACLYGNDYLNRSIITRVTPNLKQVNDDLKITNNKLTELANTQSNISTDISQLKTLVDDQSRKASANQSLISEVNRELDRIMNYWKELRQSAETSQKSLVGLNKLENAHKSTTRWEFERWILVVTLLSIMFAVLFLGVLAICKKSRGAIVAFSGLGIVIFVLAWTIFSVLLPISVAYSDFCETGRIFISHHFPDGIYSTLNYYEKCVPDNSYADTFGELHLNKIEQILLELKNEDAELRASSRALFGENTSVKALTSDISNTIVECFKRIGTISTLASCSTNHDRVHDIIQGFCYHGFLGNSIFLTAIFLFGVFMALLLMIASRGWFAFEKLPNDYVEVGDDDPFYPRQNDAIPADIYGTHVFNPRTRFANSADNNTESTGTNSGGHPQVGDQRTPLLVGDHPSWQSPPTDMTGGPNRYI